MTQKSIFRRNVLKSLSSGFGYLAFAGLAHDQASAEERPAGPGRDNPLSPKPTHFPVRAKRVIFLSMNGGPSHIDLFDHKPDLARAGEAGGKARGAGLMPSPFRFSRHGDCGRWVSELMPELARHVDDLCFIHSMQTDLPNHSQAFLQMHTGSFQFTRPSMGAWSLYGLGTENQNLPGFITISPPSDNGGAKNYGAAFLPAIYQATRIGTQQIPAFYAKMLGVDSEPGAPLPYLSNAHWSAKEQRDQLDFIQALNGEKLKREGGNPEIEGAIESFELAFRMQSEIPDLLDLSGESRQTMDRYGIGNGLPTDRFGRQCLLARKMAESGVRYIELTSPKDWDHHFSIKTALPESCLATDLPVAGLLEDLKLRGMLDETLVIWAGEFGRTPYAQSGTGRDHNHKGYTLWMAGGGVRGGLAYGSTDDLGGVAIEDPVHIHDWHATVLRLLGLDHRRLTYRYAGRSFRLTDVYGDVVEKIIS